MYKDITLKEALEKYLLQYSEKKSEYESASKAYFELSDADFENSEKCSLLSQQFDSAKGECDAYARYLADFVLENRDKIVAALEEEKRENREDLSMKVRHARQHR